MQIFWQILCYWISAGRDKPDTALSCSPEARRAGKAHTRFTAYTFVGQTRQAANSPFHASAMASSCFCSQMRMARHMVGGYNLDSFDSYYKIQSFFLFCFVYMLKEQRPSFFMLLITWVQLARKFAFLI